MPWILTSHILEMGTFFVLEYMGTFFVLEYKGQLVIQNFLAEI